LAATVPATDHPAAFTGLLWLSSPRLVVAVMVVPVGWLKRRMQASQGAHELSFWLKDLRRLRERGAVTAAESELLLGKALSGLRRAVHHDGEALADKTLQRARSS
ncbi:MAG: hypothetical protein V3U43_09900, partial [Pseudomonadales bacterium]